MQHSLINAFLVFACLGLLAGSTGHCLGASQPAQVNPRETLEFYRLPFSRKLPAPNEPHKAPQTVKTLEAVMAMDEKETLHFYVKSVNYRGFVKISVHWDKPLKTCIFKRVEPLNHLAETHNLDLMPRVPSHLWIKVDSEGVEPGLRKGLVVFTMKSGERQTLPFRVQIYPVKMPAENRIHLMGYSIGIGFMNGLRRNNREEHLEELVQHFTLMREARMDTLMLFFNFRTVLNCIRYKGKSIYHTVRQGILPGPAAFSDLDPYFGLAREKGFRTAVVLQTNRKMMRPFVEMAAGRKMLREFGYEYDRYGGWFLKTLAAYLRKKGYTRLQVKLWDEIKPDRIEEWIREANFFIKNGWQPFTTLTGKTAQHPEYLTRLNPYTDQWHIQRLNLYKFFKAAGEGRAVDPEDEIWFYGGGRDLNTFSYLNMRLYGWLAKYYGADGYAIWSYYHWKTKGAAVMNNNRVFSTPALEGVRDGLEDAQLFALLEERLKNGRSHSSASGQLRLPALNDAGLFPMKMALKSHRGKWEYRSFIEPTEDAAMRGKRAILEQLSRQKAP